MGKQGVKLSEEEKHTIRDMLEKGASGYEIADKLKRSANSVYWHIKNEGLRDTEVKRRPGRGHTPTDYPEYSELPDTVLFDYRKFPAF